MFVALRQHCALPPPAADGRGAAMGIGAMMVACWAPLTSVLIVSVFLQADG
jgi:hypothetical protein